MTDTYFTISEPSEGIFKDKGSKFYGFAFPFADETALKMKLDEIKQLHPKARHHCFAYRIGTDDLNYRAFDDGEPSGSAGKPILNVLQSHHLRNVLVIVVRYFGGTLLGVPGLINAYKMATQEAITNAQLIEKIITNKYQLSFEMNYMNEVMRLVKKFDLTVLSQGYTDQCQLEIAIRLSSEEEVLKEISELRFVEVERV